MEREPSTLEKIAFVYGDVCVRKKKQRRKRQKLLIMDMLYDYAQNSSLHGLRYIVERGLNIIENIFWLLTVIVSILCCAYLINKVYTKWVTSPVIVAVNERLASVGTIPFPSVTICPQYKVNPNIYNYTDANSKYDHNELKGENLTTFLRINSLCDVRLLEIDPNDNLSSTTYVEDITKVSLTEDDIFFACSWYNTNEDCDDLFSRVYTQEGVCYSMNSLAENVIFNKSVQQDELMNSNTSINGWSFQYGYENYSMSNPYPRRGHVFGSVPDLSLILIHDSRYKNDRCNSLYTGYKIFLQHPADFPQSSLYYYATISNQVTSLAVNFNVFTTDASLKNYPPETRQCYFPGDRNLRYFNLYTAKNCVAECFSNYTLQKCGCVGYYMPHDNTTKICPPIEFRCIAEANEYMAERELNPELDNKCHCLTECNTIEYDAEVLKREYNLNQLLKQWHMFSPNQSYSQLLMYFKKPQSVTMQRRELFGTTDFLANIGGLLGLFLGFSFMSLIEVFYFLTLRVGFTLKRDLDEERAKKKKLLPITEKTE